MCFSRYYEIDDYADILRLAAQQGLSLNAFYFARQFGGYNEYVAEQAAAALRHPSPDCLYVLVEGEPAADTLFRRQLQVVQCFPYTLGKALAAPAGAPPAAGGPSADTYEHTSIQ